MVKATTAQIRKLHCLYRELNIDSKELIADYTNGRTDSTAGLTKTEALKLISALTIGGNKAQKFISTIYTLAYKAGIIYSDTEQDNNTARVKLNLFLNARGTVKKDLEKMNLTELKRTHRQMEGVARNSEKTRDNRVAKEATDRLLMELNITVA